MLEIIISIVITLIATIWPIKKAAEWLGAENSSYGAVILAIILTLLFTVGAAVLAIPLAFLGIFGFILSGVLGFFLVGKAYSIALKTPFWNGIGIAVIAMVIAIILQLIFVFVLGFGMFATMDTGMSGKDIDVASVEEASSTICRCNTEDTCADMVVAEAMGVMMQAMMQVSDPNSDLTAAQRIRYEQLIGESETCSKGLEYELQGMDSDDLTSDEEAATVEEEIEDQPEAVVVNWLPADIKQVDKLVGREIRVTTIQGTERIGTLSGINDLGLNIVDADEQLNIVPVHQLKTVEIKDE